MSATNTTESTELGDNGTASPPNIGSALVAENRFVAIEGATLVYRRFGNAEIKAPPLVCLQHFRGNLDNWDPALIDRLAQEREMILLANRGVGASTGVVPDNVSDMARDVIRFVDVLPLREIDLLGFSLGGYIGQELALVRPRLIRRLVLASTAPQGAPKIHRWTDDVYALATQGVPDRRAHRVRASMCPIRRLPQRAPRIATASIAHSPTQLTVRLPHQVHATFVT